MVKARLNNQKRYRISLVLTISHYALKILCWKQAAEFQILSSSSLFLGKLGIYDADGDGDFDVEDAKVLLGKYKHRTNNQNNQYNLVVIFMFDFCLISKNFVFSSWNNLKLFNCDVLFLIQVVEFIAVKAEST